MSESQNIQPSWMKLNPNIDHFDPFEGVNKLKEETVRNFRYGITIGSKNILFAKSIFCEVTTNTNIYPIPNVALWLNGMINLRGNLIPVFEIDSFLNDQGKSNKKKKVVFVIGVGVNAVGLLIHELPVTVEIDEENIEAIYAPENTPEIFSDAISNAYDINNKVWLEIDIDKVIENLKSHKSN